MGSFNLKLQQLISKCLDVERVEKLRQSLDPAVLDSSSQLDVFIVSSARVTMLPVLVLVPQSTLLLRFLSWLAMLPVTTRRPESSQDICNWLSEMTRSRTNFLLESPLPRE